MKTDLINASVKAIRKMEEPPSPPFDYSVGWAEGYQELFSGRDLDVKSVSSVPDRAYVSGRVLLCGRAGSGKSVILRSIARAQSKIGALVVFIDLSKWTASDTESVKLFQDFSSVINFIIKKFSILDATLLDIDLLDADTPKVLLVDGLNEVPMAASSVIVEAVDDCMTRLMTSCAVVTDRLVRRQVNIQRWCLARVEPLSSAAIDKALSGKGKGRLAGLPSQLFDWPLFLAKALEDRKSSESAADALQDFFKERVGLSEAEMAVVADAAYSAYAESGSRTFDRHRFTNSVGESVAGRLVNAGAIYLDNGMAYFGHHLNHDYLAAYELAGDKTKWNYAGFDTLSFQASSFDAIALAFAIVPKELKARFVREVYDWNPYAIAYALSEEEYRKSDDLDRELEQVVLAMLSEKRWDHVIPTRVRATDALSLFPAAKARPFLNVKSRSELLRLVEALDGMSSWFVEWKRFFCMDKDNLTETEISRLGDDDSIMGWTLANVLKQVELSQEQLALVVGFSRDQRPVVRWRSAHVIGAFPSKEAMSVVLSLLDEDANDWVRYGALRSAVEMSARAEVVLRDSLMDSLSQRRSEIERRRRLRDELGRALRIEPKLATEGWLFAALGLVSKFIDLGTSMESIDFWSRAMRDLRSDYRS